ncbi:bifunctional adenosylcobinamide kinase/adenosylcobinamide-phosphate guanylyltransferase [Thermosulfurimonas sp. F29]|uniref:bifunctional adenosylcobinamide kinase/adenosylcobinamide-phosphate guanylyltransferase n=1 Tax=Thermosulfurimonas sp. F29 TaxID=2867247 RepID=UPI001C83BBEF|nr:bifunctional adenosylcobinamide kinase/adenosylcobinamide-phosphate guanylyltransferase [Thermosulfurimonas sp. F29]MBX6423306.1 bifunctional adenosylcobinamide kinase/adenosylcobinamide-phosphate guanylyltransferase [Thermosulfurimonas sp. F29]
MRTLILGGTASGKSRLALRMALSAPSPRVFIATAEPTDQEMEEKIARHRRERGGKFLTLEEPLDLAGALRRSSGRTTVVDCLTVWVGNLLHYGEDPEGRFRDLVEEVKTFSGRLFLVSNEVGLSPVAPDPLTRRYVNLLGRLNRTLASLCEEVLLVVAGCVIPLKPFPGKP